MGTLNRKVPYGIVYGHSKAKFTQGGKYFDGSGNEISLGEALQPGKISERVRAELNKERERMDLPPLSREEFDEASKSEDSPAAETKAAEEGSSDAATEAEGTPTGAVIGSKADEDEASDKEAFDRRVEEAMKLHPAALKSLCDDVYEKLEDTSEIPEPYTGEGSKKKNAHWLAHYGPAD